MTVHTAEHIRIESANVPPAQTWNRLRANSLALTVPKTPDAGTVYLPLPVSLNVLSVAWGLKLPTT